MTREVPNTFFGKSNQDTRSEPPTKHKLCSKSHVISTCSEFKVMEHPKDGSMLKILNCF